MPLTFDVAIVGSGFAGTILARVLHRAGLEVALVERTRHPRFALGESSTPLAALALERLAARFDLPDLHHLAAYGRWLRHHPTLRRGKKRGFTFFRHQPHQPFSDHEDASEDRHRDRHRKPHGRLLVAASPNDALADCHWLRADVDRHLVERAQAEGVAYFDETDVREVDRSGSQTALRGVRQGQPFAIAARHVVDGTGPSGLIAGAAGVGHRPSAESLLASSLLYTHVESLPPFADIARARHADGRAHEASGTESTLGPYPDDQAAVHHILDEGWMYQLPFDHGIASVGLLLADPSNGGRRHGAAQRAPIQPTTAPDPAAIVDSVLARYPSLAEQFETARAVRPWKMVSRLQYRRTRAAGPGWFLLPHTFAFVDPLFSTGMAWSLLAVERLADVLTGRAGDADGYARLLVHEADAIERLIATAYQARHDFARFVAVTFLYFAAVSFEEVRQRLLPAGPGQVPDAWRGFLGTHEASRRQLFTDAHRRLQNLGTDGAATAGFEDWVRMSIAPFNVAGLANPKRRNRYPLDLDELVRCADRLGLSRHQVIAALPRLRGEA